MASLRSAVLVVLSFSCSTSLLSAQEKTKGVCVLFKLGYLYLLLIFVKE